MNDQATTYSELTDPLGSIIDRAIISLVRFFIPNQLLSSSIIKLITTLKGLILIVSGGLFLVTIVLFSGLSGNSITGSIGNAPATLYQGLPPELEGYIETGFDDTGFPRGNPFGGRSYEFARKTAGYNDPAYYSYYGRWHDGLDVVPNQRYYDENKAYRLTGQPIIFATCSGVATGKIDGYGGLYVSIDCRDGQQIWLLHNQVNFVPPEPTAVRAGQPVGILGNTGMSDGAHVHYVVRIKSATGGTYTNVNPEPYL